MFFFPTWLRVWTHMVKIQVDGHPQGTNNIYFKQLRKVRAVAKDVWVQVSRQKAFNMFGYLSS